MGSCGAEHALRARRKRLSRQRPRAAARAPRASEEHCASLVGLGSTLPAWEQWEIASSYAAVALAWRRLQGQRTWLRPSQVDVCEDGSSLLRTLCHVDAFSGAAAPASPASTRGTGWLACQAAPFGFGFCFSCVRAWFVLPL